MQHCTSQLQSKYCRGQITVLRPFNTKRVQRNTACKKCCKVKHNSESVFHYFASAENSNYMLWSAIRGYSSLKKASYVPLQALYTFRKSLFDVQRLGF